MKLTFNPQHYETIIINTLQQCILDTKRDNDYEGKGIIYSKAIPLSNIKYKMNALYKTSLKNDNILKSLEYMIISGLISYVVDNGDNKYLRLDKNYDFLFENDKEKLKYKINTSHWYNDKYYICVYKKSFLTIWFNSLFS